MAAAPATTTTFDAALKQLYPKNRVKFIGYEHNPLLALMPKDENFGGRNMPLVIWYGGNQGASRTFSVAQAGKTPGLYEDFLLTRKKDYGLSSIEMETILATATDEMAFLKASAAEVDNTVRTVSRNLAISMYRNYGGARGQIATGGISGGTLTLADPADIVNFEKGQTLVQSTADGTSGALGSGESLITGVNRRAGTLTAANWTNFTAGDYLFRKGDFGLSVNGLADWIPATAPTGGDNFLGVDRSSDTRLYGQYHDGSTTSIQEAFEDADAKVNVEGGALTHVFCNPLDFNVLRKSLGSAAYYDKARSPDMASISFSTIKLMGMNGDIQIVPDRNCPHHKAFGLDMKTWVAASLGGQPRILEGMGNKFIWDYNADSIEVRVGYYGNIGCHAPSMNIQIKLP
jgi:hypothetical protein